MRAARPCIVEAAYPFALGSSISEPGGTVQCVSPGSNLDQLAIVGPRLAEAYSRLITASNAARPGAGDGATASSTSRKVHEICGNYYSFLAQLVHLYASK